MTSYAISQNYDFRDVLTAGLWSLWAFLRTLALLLVAGVVLAGVFALVAMFWLPVAQFIGGLAIVALFGYATYPRSKAVK